MPKDVALCSHPGLDPRLRILRVGEEVDALFVRTERFGALIDTLGTPALCARALELLRQDLDGRPLLVVNSHLDWDHAWGNAAVAERAPILAHAAALERLRDGRPFAELREKAAAEARFRGVRIVPPTATFAGDLVLRGGDLTLELLHTPGHAPDHLSVWIPELRTCLAVDAAEDPIPEVWSETAADLAALRASLERLRGLRPALVLPAHGQTAFPGLLDRNLTYFGTMAARVRDAADPPGDGAALAARPGFRLEDLVPDLRPLLPEALAFYRGCHARNLGATLRAVAQEWEAGAGRVLPRY